MFQDESTRCQNKKRMLQQPLKITYAISLYIVRIYPNGNCICPYFPGLYPYFPYLVHIYNVPEFGSYAFLLNSLVSNPYIVCSLVAGYSDDFNQYKSQRLNV